MSCSLGRESETDRKNIHVMVYSRAMKQTSLLHMVGVYIFFSFLVGLFWADDKNYSSSSQNTTASHLLHSFGCDLLGGFPALAQCFHLVLRVAGLLHRRAGLSCDVQLLLLLPTILLKQLRGREERCERESECVSTAFN